MVAYTIFYVTSFFEWMTLRKNWKKTKITIENWMKSNLIWTANWKTNAKKLEKREFRFLSMFYIFKFLKT